MIAYDKKKDRSIALRSFFTVIWGFVLFAKH